MHTPPAEFLGRSRTSKGLHSSRLVTLPSVLVRFNHVGAAGSGIWPVAGIPVPRSYGFADRLSLRFWEDLSSLSYHTDGGGKTCEQQSSTGWLRY
jgi:hypothetical protein